jgi:hypothetical protein
MTRPMTGAMSRFDKILPLLNPQGTTLRGNPDISTGRLERAILFSVL